MGTAIKYVTFGIKALTVETVRVFKDASFGEEIEFVVPKIAIYL